MKTASVFLWLLMFSVSGAFAAETIATWKVRPFFARRLGQVVPPPAFIATTAPMPEGAEVKIKVIECPKNARLRIHDFLGGPVFATGFKEYTDLAAGKTLIYKLNKQKTIAITVRIDDQDGTCKVIERKDGYDILRYSLGANGDFAIEVQVVGKQAGDG